LRALQTPPAKLVSKLRLRDQLEEAHWAGGFRPRQVQDLHNDLIHPRKMMIRGFYCWHQTRWPGRNGRMHYAHTLFNLYVLRYLQFPRAVLTALPGSCRTWVLKRRAAQKLEIPEYIQVEIACALMHATVATRPPRLMQQ